MKIRLIFFLGLTLLLCFGCTSSRDEERLCEIFEQSKKMPEYDEIATFVNSPKFKQICCDELVALDALYPAWRDSVSINFRSLHFYPKLDTCVVFYTMDIKKKDKFDPKAIGVVALCAGEITRKNGQWEVLTDTVRPLAPMLYSSPNLPESDAMVKTNVSISRYVYIFGNLELTYHNETQLKKYLDCNDEEIAVTLFRKENTWLVPIRYEEFLKRKFWFDKEEL